MHNRHIRSRAELVIVMFVLTGSQGFIDAAEGPPAIPFRETFEGGVIGPAWRVDLSPGNAIDVRDGMLHISALSNTYAHIQRPLGVDLIRASCRIRPGVGVSWTASLFLYWDPGNWCQFGVLAKDGLYVAETTAGEYKEHCDFAEPSDQWHYNPQTAKMESGARPSGEGSSDQYVAIELGRSHIAYLSSGDGARWSTVRVTTRPQGPLSGPPALLIVGKGLTIPRRFPAPDMNNDFSDKGQRTLAMIGEISVVPTDSSRLDLPDKRLRPAAGADSLGEAEIAGPADPSYESVARHFPAMKHSRETVGVKDHPCDFGVTPDGAVEVNTGFVCFMVNEPPVRFGLAGKGARKRLEKGYLPIVIADWNHDDLSYEQTVCGYSEAMSPDTEAFACIRLRIDNSRETKRRVPLRIENFKADGKPLVPGQSAATWALEIEGKGNRIICIKVPSSATDANVREVSPGEFDTVLKTVTGTWEDLLNRHTRITVPEERVNNAYRAWLAYNFLNADKKGNVYEPHDGSGFYEMIYGYSAALYCQALDLMGHHADARRYLESLLTFLKPDGYFVVNYGLPDQGVMLCALAHHYRMTGDSAWLRTVAPTMVRMCEWIIQKRRTSKSQQSPTAAWYGLILDRPYCDHPSPAYCYKSDTYLVAGMEATASALADIGLKEEGSRIGDEATAYRKDVLDSMAKAVIDRDGMKMLPIFPQTQELLKASDYNAYDYYGLMVGPILETGFLPAGSPQAKWYRDMLEQRGGLILGMCRFWNGIDHAYTYGYWMDCLARDEVRRVLLGFYGSLAYGMSRETYSAVEVTFLKEGKNFMTLPHLYSNTQQLFLLRNILVREVGNELHLGQAIPQAWLDTNKEVRVERAPTSFGTVSFAIRSQVDQGRISIRIDPPTRRPAASIRVRLRHPQNAPIRSVITKEEKAATFSSDTVTLRDLRAPTTVEVLYR